MNCFELVLVTCIFYMFVHLTGIDKYHYTFDSDRFGLEYHVE